MSNRDTLFSEPQIDIAGFRFDTDVASVFPDMIQRSVPGYSSVVAMSGFLARRYAQPGTRLYDLGCSLGATSFAMAQALGEQASHVAIEAVDNSPAMLEQAQAALQALDLPVQPEFHCADIRRHKIHNASLVALNYTLQFIPPMERSNLLHSIARGMRSNGVLILSEKIAFEDSKVNDLYFDLHHDFKRSHGYSDLEISQKRSALEDVLIPETLAVHRERLLDAGFSRVELWFQCLNFASMLAFK